MKELWKPIEGYEGLYEVSNFGRVKRKYLNGKELILKPIPNWKGYNRISLSNGKGKSKIYSIHRLVGKAFIPNPLNKQQINHINGIKQDNYVDNLEWVTPQENCIHRNLIKYMLK